VAAVLVVFDSHVGGLGWRYSADFGWLISLASIPGLLWLVNGREPSRSLAGANDAASGDGIARVTPWRWLMRWVVMLAVLWALGIAILSCFVQSRSDSMIANNPTLWHQVQSWFTGPLGDPPSFSILPAFRPVFSKTCGIMYVT